MINMCDIYQWLFDKIRNFLSEPFSSRVFEYQQQFNELETIKDEQLILEEY